VHRPLLFTASLKLKEFGYIGVGASVANMTYELAAALRHENIVLIGQDLAYSDDGSSHPKEHIYGNQGETIKGEVYTEAYGGKGKVRTQLTWNLFRQTFEKDIFWVKEKLNISTYNCTEGGARIKESVEKSFLWACENLLDENLNKPFNFPYKLKQKNIQKILKKTQDILNKNTLESKNFIKKCTIELKKLDHELQKNDVNITTLKKIKINLLNLFNRFKKLKLFNELTQAIYFHNECEILKFEVLKDIKQDKMIKSFLQNQLNWWIQALAYLKTQNDCIQEALEKWQLDDMS
ncbi:TPA: motility associated factor glycosyltransferase family protein, partial [Campylobacter coli]|nr:motility associated factor glycosyltransferase family protein [Campylobacter coli]